MGQIKTADAMQNFTSLSDVEQSTSSVNW